MYSTECHACGLLETKGPSLVAKGQFQGPEIPIGLLLSWIGWGILINEMYLDFSWWIHSAANLNPGTYYYLESHCLRSVWPPERSITNIFLLSTDTENVREQTMSQTPKINVEEQSKFLLDTHSHLFQHIFCSRNTFLWLFFLCKEYVRLKGETIKAGHSVNYNFDLCNMKLVYANTFFMMLVNALAAICWNCKSVLMKQ